MLEALLIAGDDCPLFAGERAQRLIRNAPRLQLLQVAVLGQCTLN
jgi:hypothetical protein